MMTTPAAEKVLWNLKDLEPTATAEQRGQMREALQALQASADYLMLGVCAAEQLAGWQAVKSYAQHFGYEITAHLEQELPQIAGAVYLKFNPRSQRLYVDSYTGQYRGVLVSFQSDLADGYSGTHGHFPLDLFGG
jgi:Domain of unknown function (DUF1824)